MCIFNPLIVDFSLISFRFVTIFMWICHHINMDLGKDATGWPILLATPQKNRVPDMGGVLGLCFFLHPISGTLFFWGWQEGQATL